MPFADLGGILADHEQIEMALIEQALTCKQQLKADLIELRHISPLSQMTNINVSTEYGSFNYITKNHKARMMLELPQSSEILMNSFKAKLRSQIKRPVKEGMISKIGGIELIDDFYKVFSINMRDLGSPVHSRKLIRKVIEKFGTKSRIIVVYKERYPVACSLIIGFKDTLENPWSSALRKYSRFSPNMLLYWSMLKYACDNGFRYFDFGRSTPGEGTYKFKQQWGAKPTVLHWHYISDNGFIDETESSQKSKFDSAVRYWQKLPVSLTKIMGPNIRKYIGL